jgi:PIN domain nuclease of toxin-antitoxin system
MGNRYLIDTHVLLWWVFNDPKLCEISRSIIANSNNEILVSSATAWEIAIKYRIGKLPEAKPLLDNYRGALKRLGFLELAINTEHALTAGSLTIDHRDPFDRMLMAQAKLENIPIITYDPAFHLLDIHIIPK